MTQQDTQPPAETLATNLPSIAPGHWDTEAGRDMAMRTLADPRMDHSRERISDFALANEVFLSPGIANLTDAKERIRWLSANLASTLAALTRHAGGDATEASVQIAYDAYNQGYRDGCEDSGAKADMEVARDGWHDWLHDCEALKEHDPEEDADAGGDAIPAGEASEALRALERFVGDHSGNDDTTDGMEVDRRAQEALSTLRGVLAPADGTVIPAENVACRFDGIPYSSADLEIAQRAACAIVPLYGTGDHGEQEAARSGKLWNDHPAVQGALRALHEARESATPKPLAGGDAGGEFVRTVSRLTHSGDDGWTPTDSDDAADTLDGLIAQARTIASGGPAALALPAPVVEGWQPIETAILWGVYIVTDGEHVALAQYAESDWGGNYWAVDPEDALEWSPTHCITPPAALLEGRSHG